MNLRVGVRVLTGGGFCRPRIIVQCSVSGEKCYTLTVACGGRILCLDVIAYIPCGSITMTCSSCVPVDA